MDLIIKIPDEVYKTVQDGSYCGSLYEELLAAIPYNPSGDLISREDLRKEVTEKVNFTTVDGHIAYDKMLKLIDNAPTVPQVTVFAEDADEKAIEDMKAELQNVIEARPNEQIAWEQGYEAGLAQGKAETRPKGEWTVTKLQHGEDVTCPFCNARPTKSEYGYYLRDNFCHECGADMRKGGTE